MRRTRRYWAALATATVLLALGVLFGRPLALVGGASVGGALLGWQLVFARRLRRTLHTLGVDLSVPGGRVARNDRSLATLAVARPADALGVTVTAETPVSVEGPPATERSVTLAPGEERAETTFPVSWEVAGTVSFDAPAVVVADGAGLFRETVRLGSTPALRVEPRRPGRLHVGEGGDQVGFALGEHRSGGLGTGIDPGELRRYVPGDDAGDIDWKATARLDDVYVRDREVQTARKTVVLFDHRSGLADGPPGGTQLDYLREVALTFVDQARELSDPLALYAVGDDGLTVEHDPATDDEGYLAAETALADCEPGGPTAGAGAAEPADGARAAEPVAGARATGRARDPATTRRQAARLDDDSAFARTLRPYLGRRHTYVRRVESDPLFAVARTYLGRVGEGAWVLVFTDDSDRARLRETVKVARASGADSVAVFLAPDALFAAAGLADLDGAYERYADFESFRRSLARLDGVSAFEVGPGDRIDAVLSSAPRS